jgi:hypothetical protein
MNSNIIIGEYEYIGLTSDRAFRKLLTSMEESIQITKSLANAVLFHDADGQSKKNHFIGS